MIRPCLINSPRRYIVLVDLVHQSSHNDRRPSGEGLAEGAVRRRPPRLGEIEGLHVVVA